MSSQPDPRRLYRRKTSRCWCLIVTMALILAGVFTHAAAEDQGRVVVYTSHDRHLSEPILKLFEEKTGIRVEAVYDTEAVKTVGLVNRLLAERARPRADVFWNNEILRTIQLQNAGLLEPYESPSAEKIPDELKDPDHYWAGFGARARVILVNRNLLPDEEKWPSGWGDLANPDWKGQGAFARPLFGTTNTHAAIQYALTGEESFRDFWHKAREISILEVGNAQTRDAVVAGEAAWCFTDTDDAYGAIADGVTHVEMLYADALPDRPGVLLIPNTVMLMRNSPNGENGRKLIDFLLSEDVEARLAASRAAQIPVRPHVKGPQGIPSLEGVKILEVDWASAYSAIAPASGFLQGLFSGR